MLISIFCVRVLSPLIEALFENVKSVILSMSVQYVCKGWALISILITLFSEY